MLLWAASATARPPDTQSGKYSENRQTQLLCAVGCDARDGEYSHDAGEETEQIGVQALVRDRRRLDDPFYYDAYGEPCGPRRGNIEGDRKGEFHHLGEVADDIDLFADQELRPEDRDPIMTTGIRNRRR